MTPSSRHRNATCPCGSGVKYKRCCGPLHSGAPPATAAALVRARFAAYRAGIGSYIVETTHRDSPHRRDDEKTWLAELREQSLATSFIGLTFQEETTTDDEAWITYVVSLVRDGRQFDRTERGYFKRADGRWSFVYGLRLNPPDEGA